MNALYYSYMKDAEISFPMFGDLTLNPPATFHLFGIEIYYYGVIIAFGMVLAMIYCSRRAKSFGLTSDNLFDLLIWIIPLSIVGARLYYVAFKWSYYSARPEEIVQIWNGGLAIYGGIIMGLIVGIVWCRVKKISFFATADLLSFGLLIGQAVGRWGNFMNREAYGAETDIFCRMGLTYPGASETYYVHPTFLYESLWNFTGFLILHFLYPKRAYDGQIALVYCAWYGLGRAMIEGLRMDSLYWGSFRVSQVLAAVGCVAAVAALVFLHFRPHDPEKLAERVYARKLEEKAATEKTEQQ